MNRDLIQRIELLCRQGKQDQAQRELNQAAATPVEQAIGSALINYHRSDYARALDCLQAVPEPVDDPEALCWMKRLRAQALNIRGDVREALTQAEAAVAAARECGSKLGEANALVSKANALRMLDRHQESLAAAEAALIAARECGDKLGEANALWSKAEALRMLGRHQESLAAAEAAAAAARECGDKLAEANALETRAAALRMLGRHQESLAAAEAATTAARECGSKLAEANARLARCRALVDMGRAEDAVAEAAAALEVARELGDSYTGTRAAREVLIALVRAGKADQVGDIAEWLKTTAPKEAPQTELAVAGLDVQGILTLKQAWEEKFHQRLTREPTDITLPEGAEGAFVLYRDWASYSTVPLARAKEQPAPKGPLLRASLADPVCGGYLLHWRGQGLAIDPGLGFLGALDDDGLAFRDINEVVLTHYHIDHVDDLLQLLTCEHEYREATRGKQANHRLPFLLSPSCDRAFHDLLAGQGRQLQRLSSTGPKLEALGGSLSLQPIPAKHLDLTDMPVRLSDETPAVGLRIEARDAAGTTVCTIGLTGDTGWVRPVSEAYCHPSPVDVLVLHLGSVYPQDKTSGTYAPNHLGWNGACQLVADVARAHGGRPWLVVVSEWGQELAEYRSQIARALQAHAGKGRVIPGVRGLHIALPQCRPVCQVCRRQFADHWVASPAGEIIHVCRQRCLI